MNTKKTLNNDGKLKMFFVYVTVVYTFILAAYPGTGVANILSKVIFMGFYLLCICKARIILDDINLLMAVFAVYMAVSLMISFAFNGVSFGVILKEYMYEVFPILLFITIRYYNINIKNMFNLFVVVCLLFIILGLPVYFRQIPLLILSDEYTVMRNSAIAAGFGSYIGVIGMGYLSQLAFAVLLFDKTTIKYKKVFLILFFTFSLLTLQRSALLGLMFSIMLFFFQKAGNPKQLLKNIFLLLLIIVLFILVLNKAALNFFPYDIGDHIRATLRDFNLKDALGGRSDQMFLYSDNIFQIIFGNGMGVFSPNNPHAIYSISDSSYYRIYNELGIVGLSLFILPFLLILYKAINKKNYYLIYLVGFSLVSFYFNRTIWSIPGAYVFYIFLALEIPVKNDYIFEVEEKCLKKFP